MATLSRFAVCVCAAAVTLLSCSGAQAPMGVQHPIPPSAALEAMNGDLLYISDPTFNDVYIYSYPALKPVGTLTGFNLPGGLCSDRLGNVFVADLLDRQIFEYGHGNSKRIETLNVNGYPEGCSVDPSTGNLAVANYGSSGSPGDIAIFPHARGTPAIYSDPTMISFTNCAYDESGNLFADGQKYGNAPGLVELPNGGGALKDLAFTRSFDAIGSVQWDGHYIVVGGNSRKSLYRLAISGSKVKVVGRTILESLGLPVSFWIEGKRILFTSYPPHSKYTAIGVWAYPNGDAPKKTIRQLPYVSGLTISLGR